MSRERSTSRRLVLASTSPFRRELLGRLKIAFDTIAPEIDESPRAGETPDTLVVRLAEAKARAAAAHYTHALVIGSDQVASLDGEILGKPGDHAHAVEQLTRLAGRRVRFLTGLCLLDAASGAARTALVPYEAHFRALERTEIERYLAREPAYHCAGALRSEGLGIALLERMSGDDPTALIGLPLIRLAAMLREAGLDVP